MGVVRDTAGWWGEQCSARGPALSHIHHARQTGCEATDHHPDQCCYCGLMEGAAIPPPVVRQVATEQRIATQDHRFIFTIAGCRVCRKPEDSHPIFLPEPEGECSVDHRSIRPGLLVGDEGLEWRRCPVCMHMVEPAMAQGHPEGPSHGPGRLPWVERRWKEIIKVRDAFLGGFYKS